EAQEEAHQEYLEQQAAEAKKSGGLGLRGIISIVVAVVAVGAGGWGLWQKIQTDQALKEGNCIVLSGTADDASEKKIECDKEPFSWKVASIAANEAGCPTEDTVPYTVTSKSRRGASRTDKVACLAPNLHEGKCYQEVDDALTPYKEVECTAGNAKISKVIEEANATCEAPSEPWSLPTAKRTYCVEPVA
ncbi:MAG: hypothetical protein Q4D89_10985, partial [Arachnia propionica]|nr:hypothetical protein [Arachnia propionica]